VWKGATTVLLARELRNQLGGGVVVAVDTWLGALEFLPIGYTLSKPPPPQDEERNLEYDHGFPSVYYTFLSNMVQSKVSDMVIPFAAPSVMAAAWLQREGLQAELVYIDASHEMEDVLRDLRSYWPILSARGTMVGDDYSREYWPGVVEAVDAFALRVSATHSFHVEGAKWILRPRSWSPPFVSSHPS
jgi:hypothetical protein